MKECIFFFCVCVCVRERERDHIFIFSSFTYISQVLLLLNFRNWDFAIIARFKTHESENQVFLPLVFLCTWGSAINTIQKDKYFNSRKFKYSKPVSYGYVTWKFYKKWYICTQRHIKNASELNSLWAKLHFNIFRLKYT